MRRVIAIALLLCAGCASTGLPSRGRAYLNCQDYANAYAREASARGFITVVASYQQDSGQRHAVVYTLHDGGMFIEPQTGQRIELSRRELESASCRDHYYRALPRLWEMK